jgi:hypothetical protein
MIRNTCIIGIFFLIFSCMNPQKLLTDPSKDRIYFGKTGGFTNIPMEYVLFEKGQLFKMENDSLLKVRKLGMKQIKSLDSLLAKAELDTLDLNEPGNITYHIKVVKSGSEKEVKWSDASDNESVRELYNALLATIKKD